MILFFSFCVKFFVNFFEVRIGDVSVNLSSSDVGVTEKTLDGANICTIHEEIGGKTMA